VGFRQDKAARVTFIEPAAQEPDNIMGFWQVFARRTLPLDEIGHGVDSKAVHSEIPPELHHVPDFFTHGGIVEIKVRLMTEKTVPVILLGNRVPGPVGELRIREDNTGTAVTVVRI